MDVDRLLNLEVIFGIKEEPNFTIFDLTTDFVDYLNRDGLVLKTQISVTLKERYYRHYNVHAFFFCLPLCKHAG